MGVVTGVPVVSCEIILGYWLGVCKALIPCSLTVKNVSDFQEEKITDSKKRKEQTNCGRYLTLTTMGDRHGGG